MIHTAAAAMANAATARMACDRFSQAVSRATGRHRPRIRTIPATGVLGALTVAIVLKRPRFGWPPHHPRGVIGVRRQASALAFNVSNSACVIAPLSSSALAFSISPAAPPLELATDCT